MKLCIPCGQSAKDNALSCDRCGEGSWLVASLDDDVAPSLAIEIPLDPPASKKAGK
jgi:hypothetical protein